MILFFEGAYSLLSHFDLYTVTVFWACYNLGLLCGSDIFVRHWAYWQTWIEMFTEANPSGYATNSDLNYKLQRLAIAIGVIVAFKRLIVGVFLSRQTFRKSVLSASMAR